MITNASKKIKSGADRKSIIAEIKAKNLTEVVKNTYGKNYTNCKTEDLEKILSMNNTSIPKEAPAKKEVPNNPAMKTTDLSSYITKAELREVIESLLKEMENAEVDYVEDVDINNISIIGDISSSNSNKEDDSPYSSNELDDMFKDM